MYNNKTKICKFKKILLHRYFERVEPRESLLANKNTAYNNLKLRGRNGSTNQMSQYIAYHHMTTWWMPPDQEISLVIALSTAEDGMVVGLFQK